MLVATSERKREIAADMRKARGQVRMAWVGRALGWLTLAAALPAVRLAGNSSLERRRSKLAILGINLESTVIAVDFDMESAVGDLRRRLHEAFGRMEACEGRWSVASSQRINNVKARTFATPVVDRTTVRLARGADALIGTR